MLITWMAYAMAFTAIVAGGGVALEHLAAIWDLPRRVVWFAALVLAGVVPLVLALRPAAPVQTHEVIPASAPAVQQPIAATRMPVARRQARTTSTALAPRRDWRMPSSWNRYAAFGWAVTSLILLALIARSFAALRRRRASWGALEVDGREVLIAEDVGPAVVGALQPRIVLPAWVLELSSARARHDAAPRGGAHRCSRSGAVAPRRRGRRAASMECRALAHRAAAPPDDRARLRPPRAGRPRHTARVRHDAASRWAPETVRRFRTRHRSWSGGGAFSRGESLPLTTLRPSRPLVASLPFAAVALVAAAVTAANAASAPLVTAPAPGDRR